MGLVVRIYDILSPHDFIVGIKSGDTPYPLDSGYIEAIQIYPGGTTQIELSGITYPGGEIEDFDFDTQYWVKITDIVTGRYIIENIFINNPIAFDCNCNPPIILSLNCYLDELDCDLELIAEYRETD